MDKLFMNPINFPGLYKYYYQLFWWVSIKNLCLRISSYLFKDCNTEISGFCLLSLIYLSFAQFVYFLRKVCLYFNLWMINTLSPKSIKTEQSSVLSIWQNKRRQKSDILHLNYLVTLRLVCCLLLKTLLHGLRVEKIHSMANHDTAGTYGDSTTKLVNAVIFSKTLWTIKSSLIYRCRVVIPNNYGLVIRCIPCRFYMCKQLYPITLITNETWI